jgi:hypothetical protein
MASQSSLENSTPSENTTPRTLTDITNEMSSQVSLECAKIRYKLALSAHHYRDCTAAKRDIRSLNVACKRLVKAYPGDEDLKYVAQAIRGCKNDASQSPRILANFADLEVGARKQHTWLTHYSDIGSFDPEEAKGIVQNWSTMGVRLMELALETLEQFLDLNEQLEWVEER